MHCSMKTPIAVHSGGRVGKQQSGSGSQAAKQRGHCVAVASGSQVSAVRRIAWLRRGR